MHDNRNTHFCQCIVVESFSCTSESETKLSNALFAASICSRSFTDEKENTDIKAKRYQLSFLRSQVAVISLITASTAPPSSKHCVGRLARLSGLQRHCLGNCSTSQIVATNNDGMVHPAQGSMLSPWQRAVLADAVACMMTERFLQASRAGQ